jgi:nitrite reductase (NADH) large subunit
VISSDPAISLNTGLKQLELLSGKQVNYDKLVFATGARARQLAIPGVDSANVTQFRDISDVDFMSKIPNKSEVCVIGAGLLGLEAAVGMVKRGHNVCVVHRSDFILNRQLDKKSARLLQNNLEKMGIRFCLGSAPKVLKTAKCSQTRLPIVDSVALASGEWIETQLVVLATGIQPEIALAKSAGLDVNKAIQVNAFMETSVEDVYALGECTEFEQATFGLVAPIWQQFDVLLDRLVQKSSRFSITPVATKLKVSGINLFSAGEIDTEQESECITYMDNAHNNYRKLVVKEGLLVGAILYGNVADGSWYFQLIQNKTKVSKVLDQLVFGEAYCQAYVIHNNAFIKRDFVKTA